MRRTLNPLSKKKKKRKKEKKREQSNVWLLLEINKTVWLLEKLGN
jgi:hypothetical protein